MWKIRVSMSTAISNNKSSSTFPHNIFLFAGELGRIVKANQKFILISMFDGNPVENSPYHKLIAPAVHCLN